MKNIFLSLAYLTVLLTGKAYSSGLCGIDYDDTRGNGNGVYYVARDGKSFSRPYKIFPWVNRDLNRLIDSGACKKKVRRSECSIEFDPSNNSYYVIRNGKKFSTAYTVFYFTESALTEFRDAGTCL